MYTCYSQIYQKFNALAKVLLEKELSLLKTIEIQNILLEDEVLVLRIAFVSGLKYHNDMNNSK